MEPKRLNKFISDSGFCSRREADRLIEEERVTVNGKLPEPGTKVSPKDKVRIDDQLLNVREETPVFLLFHKPPGMSAKADMGIRDNVVRAINYPASLQPIGYLDRDSEGVLFLSNDSDLVRRMTKADYKYEMEYIVTVDKLITPEFISKLISGEETETGEKVPKTYIAKEGATRFRIILKPGTNHNIKMLCESQGYKVVHLQRVRINNFTLAQLPTGHWRALSPAEVDSLKSVVSKGTSQIADRSEGFSSISSNAGKRIGKSRPAGAKKGASGKKTGGPRTEANSNRGAGTGGKSNVTGTRTTDRKAGPGKGPAGPKGTNRRGGR